ncbi:hypothetical protein RvY_00760 [Ramazzottius varieornatus]|uniref:XRCC4 N-terminal domain-containing protein n=1 Tax=Ramazzottius varieornatus TaxID=947166 RepID=A0A1D1UNP8_RAMVA|nr:hypothetical protein RvY_00760 [Ramazzottius varieornatus]
MASPAGQSVSHCHPRRFSRISFVFVSGVWTWATTVQASSVVSSAGLKFRMMFVEDYKMFRRFSRPAVKNQPPNDDDDKDYLLIAEFLLNEASQKNEALLIVATDGTAAWKARVDADILQKMTNTARLSSVDEFAEETKKAFREPELDTTLTESTYVVEGKPMPGDNSLELKWKISHTGFAQVIGQVKLLPAFDAPSLIAHIMDCLLKIIAAKEKEVSKLETEEKEKSEAIEKLQELAKSESLRTAVMEESVRILNKAKEKNRTLGGTETTEKFERDWETATQVRTQVGDEED